MRLIHKALFRLKERFLTLFVSPIRKTIYRIRGLDIGNTYLPQVEMTWPHKVEIGNFCQIESGVFFKHDGIWSEGKSIVIGERVFLGRFVEFNIRKCISIGDDSLIGSGCKFIDHDHGFQDLVLPINRQRGAESEIIIDENVWLGAGVTVLKGVHIHKGVIVAAGSVVTRSIPQNEIWGGIPAGKIRERSSDK